MAGIGLRLFTGATARISLRVPERYVDNDPPRRLPCSRLGRVGIDASEAKVYRSPRPGRLEQTGGCREGDEANYVFAQLVHAGVALSCYAGYFSSK